MAKYQLLSEGERAFIVHGIQDNFRNDGRGCMDYRLIEVETDLLPNCSGSSHVRIGNTNLLVGVKAELEAPLPEKPNEGRIEIFVDCSPCANPEFEGKGGEDFALETSSMIKQSLSNSNAMNLNSLSVIAGSQVWVLHVDIVVLECGGNLADAASIGVKAALYDTKIPAVSIKCDGESDPEIEVSDDPYDVVRLDVSNLPVIVTLLRIGTQFIVDATVEEEVCSNSKLVLAMTAKGSVMLSKKLGSGSLHPDSIFDALEAIQDLQMKLHKKLIEKLEAEPNVKQEKGFLL